MIRGLLFASLLMSACSAHGYDAIQERKRAEWLAAQPVHKCRSGRTTERILEVSCSVRTDPSGNANWAPVINDAYVAAARELSATALQWAQEMALDIQPVFERPECETRQTKLSAIAQAMHGIGRAMQGSASMTCRPGLGDSYECTQNPVYTSAPPPARYETKCKQPKIVSATIDIRYELLTDEEGIRRGGQSASQPWRASLSSLQAMAQK